MATSPRAAASGSAAVPGKTTDTAGQRRASPSFLFLAAVLAGMAAPSWAAVHKVGGSAGWTITGNVNYTAWAASKSFRIGDTIVFEYNKKLHSVVEVSKGDYRSCNPRSALATHTTGNDSVVLTRAGHRFFLCGVPSHCALGQKVDIRVLKPRRSAAARAPAPAVSPAPSPSSSTATLATPPPKSSHGARGSANTSTGGMAPGMQKNGAAPGAAGWAVVALAVAVGAALANLISC